MPQAQTRADARFLNSLPIPLAALWMSLSDALTRFCREIWVERCPVNERLFFERGMWDRL